MDICNSVAPTLNSKKEYTHLSTNEEREAERMRKGDSCQNLYPQKFDMFTSVDCSRLNKHCNGEVLVLVVCRVLGFRLLGGGWFHRY
jgi:hypothetical protein